MISVADKRYLVFELRKMVKGRGKLIRRRAGLSQRQLAGIMHQSDATVSRLERGEISRVSFETVADYLLVLAQLDLEAPQLAEAEPPVRVRCSASAKRAS